MESQICFYLSGWKLQDLRSLKAIADFGAPVFLSALELQRCDDPPSILTLFPTEQLSIISVDVDDQKSDLQSLVADFFSEGKTHILWLQNYDFVAIKALLEELTLTEFSTQEIVYFLLESSKSKSPQWLQTLMALDGVDFRPFQNSLPAYPVDFLKKVLPTDLKSQQQLLVRGIKSDFKLKSRVLKINGSQDQLVSRGWWKNLYWNSYLLFLSVLKGTTDPLRSSIAMAFGVFVALSPVYGLQTLLIALGCLLLRLNFAVAFLGAQISIPPLYSLIVPIELIVGAWILDRELTINGDWLLMAQHHFLSWVVGFLFVGGAIALVLAFFWYILLVRKQKKVSAL